MKINFLPNFTPVRSKLRRYSPVHSQFLREHIQALRDFELVYRSPACPWAAAPLVVAKRTPGKYKMTVDLRPVNKVTVRSVWPMPHVESELVKLAGMICFATFEFSDDYWQLPLAE